MNYLAIFDGKLRISKTAHRGNGSFLAEDKTYVVCPSGLFVPMDYSALSILAWMEHGLNAVHLKPQSSIKGVLFTPPGIMYEITIGRPLASEPSVVSVAHMLHDVNMKYVFGATTVDCTVLAYALRQKNYAAAFDKIAHAYMADEEEDEHVVLDFKSLLAGLKHRIPKVLGKEVQPFLKPD